MIPPDGKAIVHRADCASDDTVLCVVVLSDVLVGVYQICRAASPLRIMLLKCVCTDAASRSSALPRLGYVLYRYDI